MVLKVDLIVMRTEILLLLLSQFVQELQLSGFTHL